MFGKKTTAHKIASLVGAGTTVTGDVVFAGGLRIDGTVRGAVRCVDGHQGGMLQISETGCVEGDVQASQMVLAGRVVGAVQSSELLELQPTARITGDAIIDGHLIHDDGGVATKSSPALKLAVAKTDARIESKVESAAG
jgi:cytoskeletal protein CcmA (bactofilin family)